jgi:replicative superfamily II helicase
MVQVKGEVFDAEGNLMRILPALASGDDTHLATLVAEVVAEGHSVLIFCPSKRECSVGLINQVSRDFAKGMEG